MREEIGSIDRAVDPAGEIPRGAGIDHLDVLIVGAGLSGIDAAYHLQQRSPDRRYAIFEARDGVGGTWDLFRYPGIRSDSDMHTLGFPFHPWRAEKSIADGGAIRDYIEDTAKTFGIDRHIRFGHKVVSAAWSSAEARWTVEFEAEGRRGRITCAFLFMCSGYYDYEAGHRPDFPGQEDFAGRWVHPQHWPEDIELKDREVVVIGSGATAITLVPALAARGARVTMLQRSPSYIVSRPARDRIANGLFRWLPRAIASPLVRWKNVGLGLLIFRMARNRPDRLRALIKKRMQQHLPDFPDLDRHFTPRYAPWDQRLCLVPDGDLFEALRDGRARIVTDGIERVTPRGLALQSGETLDADIIVTATGLSIKLMGGVALSIDGVPADVAKRMVYKGMMLAGVPNMALSFGYTNASWTLKIDLVSQYVCRLLNRMRDTGMAICEPGRPAAAIEPRPMLDFSSGYVKRADHILPKQGSEAPWRVHQNYALDLAAFRFGSMDDGVMTFRRAGAR